MQAETIELAIAMGARVRGLRLLAGLTQKELGERVDIAPPHVSVIESGRVNVTLETIVRLARELGVTAAELIEPPRRRGDG